MEAVIEATAEQAAAETVEESVVEAATAATTEQPSEKDGTETESLTTETPLAEEADTAAVVEAVATESVAPETFVAETAETEQPSEKIESAEQVAAAETVVVAEEAETVSAAAQPFEIREAGTREEAESSDIGAEQPSEEAAETEAETANTEAVPAAVTATAPEVAPEPESAPKPGWAARLKQGLSKSRDKMAKSLAGVFGGGKIDEDLYEELETVLITSDMGMEATEYLMKDVRNRVSFKGLKDGEELRGALKEAVYDLIKPLEQPLVLPQTNEPFVIMLAGINGAGKTTSIGKLAKYFQSQGKSVLLAAGDTFRAAAREQLQEWGERNGVTVISQSTGDSAAVCFDAVQAAKARGIDVVLADTAGRLPTQLHLMEEIKKVKRVLQKAMPDAPHEIIVVLDANIGQNAVNQVRAFDDALGLTGLIVTKLDGTAKGGVLAALASDRPIPVRYIGVGEGIDDLRPFGARAFVDALLD
ncbi:signal recognition particle-docking protein FtsY [Bergeriella denitrificans]|uniref:signal recognition particle-docking protein FtsY n=1 Tax=Bergeriella denitrificans TaxID=494 RepID=UPI003A0FF9A8